MVESGSQAAAQRTRELERDLSRVEGKGRWVRRSAILLGVVLIVAAVVAWRIKHRPPPPSKYVLQKTTTGDVIETVQSTGTVQPLTQVQVGAQVSGRVVKVYVDFNSEVKQGDLIAEIDPTLLGAQVAQTDAQLRAAQASLARSDAQLRTSKVALDRTRNLFAERLASQADVDSAQGDYDAQVAAVAAAKATISQINAELSYSRTNLAYTKIFAPIDGVVISRNVDPGQTVAASFQAPTLFVIAQDLSKMRVMAEIDEADVGKLQEGMKAEATVDAFPGIEFEGKVVQVRYSPNTSQGVVTYSAVVDVDNPERRLRPGMTALVTVRTHEAKGVVRLPNAALRYKPSAPKGQDGKPIPQPPLPALDHGKARIYQLSDTTPGAEKIAEKIVEIGITDGINTEVRGGSLAAGQDVVVDEVEDANAADSQHRRNMF